MSDLLTVQTIARRLNKSPHWVRTQCRAGHIPHRLIGQTTYLTEDDWTEYLNRVRQAATDPLARTNRAQTRRGTR